MSYENLEIGDGMTASNSFLGLYFSDDKEQIELGRFVDKITTIGAKVVLSNSDPKNADKNDCFFDELYSSYSIQRVSAKRMINSNAKNRGSINELLISNY